MPEPGPGYTWHDTVPLTDAAVVPDLIQSTNTMVEKFLDQNQIWAQSAITTANASIAALANARLPNLLPEPPSVSSSTSAPSVGSNYIPPSAPSLGGIVTEYVAPYTHLPVAVDTPTGDPGVYIPVIGGLTIPEPPVYAAIPGPPIPPIDYSFVVPNAPVQDFQHVPALLDIAIPTYTQAVLPLFNDAAPTFDVLPPTPFIQWSEPVYSSGIKTAIEGVLQTMLAGGTGLPPDVERAIWERARQREDISAATLVRTAVDQWAARGFASPPGQLNGQMLAINEENQIKITQLSRDVAIKQAELEQVNRNFAVQHGISYEQVFTALFMSIVDRNFQIAKFTVETTIQVYNMQIAAFNVEQAVFAQVLEQKKVQLEVAMLPLKVYQAQLEAAKIQSEINVQRIQAFNAEVQAFVSEVEAYKAQVTAAVEKTHLQQLKIELFKGEVESQVAQINAQRASFEAYSSRINGEVAKAGLEESNARVYASKVGAYAARSEITIKRAEVQIQTQKLDLDWNAANLQRISNWNNMQLAQIHANLSAYQASVGLQTAVNESDRANRQVQFQATVELGKLNLGKYSAQLEAWKANATQVIESARLQAESIRASGQIAATMAAGAMAGTHVSAGISAGASSQNSLNNSRSEAKSFSQNTNDAVSVTFSHPYKPI